MPSFARALVADADAARRRRLTVSIARPQRQPPQRQQPSERCTDVRQRSGEQYRQQYRQQQRQQRRQQRRQQQRQQVRQWQREQQQRRRQQLLLQQRQRASTRIQLWWRALCQSGAAEEGGTDAGTAEDEEAASAARFFELLEDVSWSLPRGEAGLHVKALPAAADASGGTLLVAFSSSSAHFDFEATLRALRAETACALALHGLLVSDAEMAWFVRTPLSDADDEFSAVEAVVGREVARLRPQRVLTIGYCRAGYAAVRCGVALRASRILAFSPTCYLRPAQRRALHLPPCYFDGHLASLHQHAPHVPLASLFEALSAQHSASAARPSVQWRRERAAQLPTEVDVGAMELHVGGEATADVVEIELHVGGDATADVAETHALVDEWHDQAVQRQAATAAPLLTLTLSRHIHRGGGHELPLFLKAEERLLPLLDRLVAADTHSAACPVAAETNGGSSGLAGARAVAEYDETAASPASHQPEPARPSHSEHGQCARAEDDDIAFGGSSSGSSSMLSHGVLVPAGLEHAQQAAMRAYLRSESGGGGVRVCHASNLSQYWSGADPYEAERIPPVSLPGLLGVEEIAAVHAAAAACGRRSPLEVRADAEAHAHATHTHTHAHSLPMSMSHPACVSSSPSRASSCEQHVTHPNPNPNPHSHDPRRASSTYVAHSPSP
jgi:hypothetical protein